MLKDLRRDLKQIIVLLEAHDFQELFKDWIWPADLKWLIKQEGSLKKAMQGAAEHVPLLLKALKLIRRSKPYHNPQPGVYIFDIRALGDAIEYMQFQYDETHSRFLMHLRQPSLPPPAPLAIDVELKAMCDDPDCDPIAIINKLSVFLVEQNSDYRFQFTQFDSVKLQQQFDVIEQHYDFVLPDEYKYFVSQHGVFSLEDFEQLLHPMLSGPYSLGAHTEEDRDYIVNTAYTDEKWSEVRQIVQQAVVFYKRYHTDGLEMCVFYPQYDGQEAVVKRFDEGDYRTFSSKESWTFNVFMRLLLADLIEIILDQLAE